MGDSTTGQWILAVLWIALLVSALYALATDNSSMFHIIAWVAIVLGIGMSALQIRRRRKELH